METIEIYIASPYGFSEAGRYFYYSKFLPSLTALVTKPLWNRVHVVIYDPWATPLTVAGETPPDSIQRVGHTNEEGILQSRIMVAVLDGPSAEDGTASECGFAYGRGKLVIGYRGDQRHAGEFPGSVVCLQVEHFIRSSGGAIATSIESLGKLLVEKIEAMLAA